MGDEEASKDIDAGEEEAEEGEERVGLEVVVTSGVLAHGDHAAHHDDAGDGIGHSHQGSVQTGRDTPDHQVPSEHTEDEHAHLEHEVFRREGADQNLEQHHTSDHYETLQEYVECGVSLGEGSGGRVGRGLADGQQLVVVFLVRVQTACLVLSLLF